jgi:hypothetical protein
MHPEHKTCTACGVEKSLLDFPKQNSSKDGRRSKCKSCKYAQQAIWYSKNKENENVRRRKRYYKDLEKSRAYGRERSRKREATRGEHYQQYRKKYNQDNKEHHRVWQRLKRQERLEVYLLSGARLRAKNKSVPFSIKVSDIVVPEYCPALGIKLQIGVGMAQKSSPTLDRFIPALGYVPGNVYVISKHANTIKNNATLEEVRMVAEWMAKHAE